MKFYKEELEKIVKALDEQTFPPSLLVNVLEVLKAIKSFTSDGKTLPEGVFELPIPRGIEDLLAEIFPLKNLKER